MRWYSWDLQTGEILNQGDSSPETAVLQKRDGCKLVLNDYINTKTHTINPHTGKKIKIKKRHHALERYDLHLRKVSEMAAEIIFREHRIGISDADYQGWREVDDVFRILAPTEYAIETNSGQLTIDALGWHDLFAAILRERQSIHNRTFKDLEKCK